MNRISSILFAISFGQLLNGQITIPTTHMPTIGDVFTYGVHNQQYTPKPPSGGVYDFSDLRQDDTTVFRYVANDKTIEFPNSNLKFTEDDNDEATVFFKKSGNDLFFVSFGALQQQLPVPGASLGSLKGTMKYASFPMTNTLNITSNDEVKTTIPKSLFQGFNIDSMISAMVPGATVDSFVVNIIFSLSMKAEGNGKIKTPIDNNIDVLRVVRRIETTPKILLYGKAFGFPLNGMDITSFLGGQLPIDNFVVTTHTFYSPSFRQEILTATLDSTGTKYESVSYRYRTKNGVIVNSIHESAEENFDVVQMQNKLEVRNIRTQTNPLLSIYTTDGKKIIEKTLNAADNSILLDKINGIVIVHLVSEGKLTTKKIALH
jgi:hypothetical protein